MPKVDVNLKRGYEASIPVEKIWSKLENGDFDQNFCVPLGENAKKEDKVLDLVKCHHILAAGSALSGAGMFRRVALATLLKFNKSEDLKFILIDPLKFSLFNFKNIDSHLVFPIITENDKAIEALEWARQEMERRFNILIENKVRNIAIYNEENPFNKIPRIVIMITELGEIMDFDAKRTEGAMIRIAQMTKAVGIHFIITTQRPSPEVITSLIKSNIPTRIAFQLPDEESSRLLIDQEGAENLLGQGDMLVDNPYVESVTERMQGYHLDEDAVENIDFK